MFQPHVAVHAVKAFLIRVRLQVLLELTIAAKILVALCTFERSLTTMLHQVIFEMAPHGETSAAHITQVWFLTIMNCLYVTGETGLCGVHFRTLSAAEVCFVGGLRWIFCAFRRLLFHVRLLDVLHQFILRDETLITVGTDKRPLTRVAEHVVLEVFFRVILLGADGTLERTFTRVLAQVTDKPTGRAKLLVAERTGMFEMRLHVPQQSLARTKPPVTLLAFETCSAAASPLVLVQQRSGLEATFAPATWKRWLFHVAS